MGNPLDPLLQIIAVEYIDNHGHLDVNECAYMCVYIHACCTSIHIQIHAHTHAYTHTHESREGCLHMNMNICMYVYIDLDRLWVALNW